MNDIRGSLRECFQAAFPAVPLSSLETLRAERDPVWDSLATLTLVTMVEEQFGVSIPTDKIPQLLSFDAMADYLETRH